MTDTTATCDAPTRDGDPCQRPAGWGRDDTDGPCRDHAERGRIDGQTGHAGHAGEPWSDLERRRILDALEDGATYQIAARAAGISARTFRRWRNDSDAVREAVERAEADAATDALGVIREAAESGDWRAAAWELENRHGYDEQGGELSAEEVREFTDVVQQTVRDELDEERAARVIRAIGDALEEQTDG